MPHRFSLTRAVPLCAALTLSVSLAASAQIPTNMRRLTPGVDRTVDSIATRVLAATGVPSATVAVVQHGRLAYAQAYGNAKLDPATPATPAMRYAIGSISKQFAATAILLLQQQGKLSLNDPVGRYIPGLTQGNRVTIREILSHTSGYQDF